MPINFRSKLHRALFAHYFSNPRTEYYVRDLSRMLSFDVAILSRELNTLARSGVFLSSLRGREKYFRLNQAHPLYHELRKITEYFVDKKSTNRR